MSIAPYLAGELFVRLQDRALSLAPEPLVYSSSFLSLLARLQKECGLTAVRTFWPLGITVIPALTPAKIESAQPSIRPLLLLIARTRPTSYWELRGRSRKLQREARLRLQLTVDPRKTRQALQLLAGHRSVLVAERIPCREFDLSDGFLEQPGPPPGPPNTVVRKRKAPGPSGGGSGQDDESQQKKENAIWGQKDTNRPESWKTAPINSIAVVDSGCAVYHPCFKQGSVIPGHWSSAEDPYGHGTIVSGLLVGNGVKALVLGKHDFSGHWDLEPDYGAFPLGSIYELAVGEKDGTGLSFPVDAGAYNFSLWLLAEQDLALRQQFALDNRTIRVLNLSLGYTEPMWEEEYNLKRLEEDAGVTVVAAAGNMKKPLVDLGSDPDVSAISVWYPAAYKTVLGVGGYNIERAPYARSRYALPKTPPLIGAVKDPAVDLCAPGVSVLSAFPYTVNFKIEDGDSQAALNNSFSISLSGTSFAAPFVSAAVAMVQLRREQSGEDTSPKAVREELLSMFLTQPPPDGDPRWGKGILNCDGLELP